MDVGDGSNEVFICGALLQTRWSVFCMMCFLYDVSGKHLSEDFVPHTKVYRPLCLFVADTFSSILLQDSELSNCVSPAYFTDTSSERQAAAVASGCGPDAAKLSQLPQMFAPEFDAFAAGQQAFKQVLLRPVLHLLVSWLDSCVWQCSCR